jgi:heme-degrading monooxygenase HmoA
MGLIETTTFRLARGSDEQAFLSSDRRVQTELIPNQPGFLRRTTARSDDGWLVLTLWANNEDAEAYAALAAGHEVQVEFEQHIDAASVTIRRYETLG